MDRRFTVHAASGYHYQDTPTLQFKGTYLNQFGFRIGDSVTVHLEENHIVITPTKTGNKE